MTLSHPVCCIACNQNTPLWRFVKWVQYWQGLHQRNWRLDQLKYAQILGKGASKNGLSSEDLAFHVTSLLRLYCMTLRPSKLPQQQKYRTFTVVDFVQNEHWAWMYKANPLYDHKLLQGTLRRCRYWQGATLYSNHCPYSRMCCPCWSQAFIFCHWWTSPHLVEYAWPRLIKNPSVLSSRDITR